MTFDLNDRFGLIELFAQAAERMNNFAHSLHEEMGASGREVRTGADIRMYEDGAKLEKWVELVVDESSGTILCWWLELGNVNNAVSVSASFDSANGGPHHPLDLGRAYSQEDVRVALESATAWLTNQRPPEDTNATPGSWARE